VRVIRENSRGIREDAHLVEKREETDIAYIHYIMEIVLGVSSHAPTLGASIKLTWAEKSDIL